ncbi:hypothetical protein D3C76_1373470 [compost metagenome]
MGQHAESGIVADHAFGIAPGGAENGGTTHAGRRQHVVEGKQARQPGQGGGGEEPTGQSQQADTGQQRDDGQQNAQTNQQAVTTVQRQERQQNAHDYRSPRR